MTNAAGRSFWRGIPRICGAQPPAFRTTVDINLGEWASTKADFCARIPGNKSPLKILLKTKDDPYFLESWIQHHAKVVGLRNLIIFDNMSSNTQVMATYAKYHPHVPIVQFDGNHDALHDTRQYPELYECLKRTCQFYVFLDTDEFLVLLNDDHTYTCDERIVRFLLARERTAVFPGSWLLNVEGSDRRFRVGESLSDFGARLAWGKPITRSNLGVQGWVNHNVQHDKRLFEGDLVPNVFVLHLMWLFPQQRIAANVDKLITLGFASPSDSVEAILAKDIESLPDTGQRQHARRFVRELRRLVTRDPRPARRREAAERVSRARRAGRHSLPRRAGTGCDAHVPHQCATVHPRGSGDRRPGVADQLPRTDAKQVGTER